jgi:hypothetical protein
VIIDLATLEARANRPSRLETGPYITGEAARQMCCDTGITRIVTDPRSQPLDVGTQGSGFTVAISQAIIARDKHCVHEGYEAPTPKAAGPTPSPGQTALPTDRPAGSGAPAWACGFSEGAKRSRIRQIHHKHHRIEQGKHSVENGELRCGYHHDAQDAHQKRQHGTYANAA